MSNVGGYKCGKRDPQDTAGNFVNFHTDHFWLVAHSSLVSLAAVITVVTKRSSSLAVCGEEKRCDNRLTLPQRRRVEHA